MWNNFLEAARFLTVLPLPPAKRHTEAALARSMAFFPAIGLLIGFFSWGMFYLVSEWVPERISVLLLIFLPIVLTGGLHLDGLADFADGFMGGSDKKSVLRIMKDPHIGTFGCAAVVLLLIAKFECLSAVPYLPYYLAALTGARWVQVVLSFFLPSAPGADGLGTQVAGRVRARDLVIASLIFFPLVVWLKVFGIIAVIGVIILALVLALIYMKRIGGLTGDLIGAASEMTELLILLLSVAFINVST